MNRSKRTRSGWQKHALEKSPSSILSEQVITHGETSSQGDKCNQNDARNPDLGSGKRSQRLSAPTHEDFGGNAAKNSS